MTKPGTAPATDQRTLSEVARHVVAPAGIKSTSWPKVRDTCRRLGWSFDGWQDGAGKLILSKRSDDSYAADTVVISIPRQVGKTYLIACIIFALCLLEPGLKVIWTAHVKDTAAETFRQFDGMAQRPKVKPHIAQVLRGKGDETILFRNGSRIEFGARESGFGRGRTDVDVLVFDEGQMLPTDTLENMGATQNVAKNPLTFVMGTPPRPRDQGEFFTLLRQEALDGESEGTLYIEMSADRGGDPMDRDQWRKANPSFPLRTTERAMLRLRKKLKNPDSWAREAMGIWDAVRSLKVITAAQWSAQALPLDLRPASDLPPAALAVDMSHDRVTAIAGCWVTDDDMRHVELLAQDRTFDTSGPLEWLVERAGRRIPVVIDSYSPAASLIPDLKARKVKVIVTSAGDMAKACGGFYADVVVDKSLTSLAREDQQPLADAVAAATKRKIGDAGGWGWDRKDPDVNIAPLVAVTLARFGAAVTKKKPSGPQRVVVLS